MLLLKIRLKFLYIEHPYLENDTSSFQKKQAFITIYYWFIYYLFPLFRNIGVHHL